VKLALALCANPNIILELLKEQQPVQQMRLMRWGSYKKMKMSVQQR
jgi:hypothetical protein